MTDLRRLQFQDELSLAAVMLYDYQDRRFQRRRPLSSDRRHRRYCQLEEALFQLRTRLSAALARIRILHDAPSLQTLLPAEVRPPEPARLRPVHAWINGNKARQVTSSHAGCSVGGGDECWRKLTIWCNLCMTTVQNAGKFRDAGLFDLHSDK